MPVNQLDKGNAFRALHRAPRAFIIANAWDAGSARILAGLGFSAIATSSWASANVYGRRDHGITREEALAHARAIADATDLPVSADLESGFGATPKEVAETYRQAAAAGLVGASIEDAIRGPRCWRTFKRARLTVARNCQNKAACSPASSIASDKRRSAAENDR
jgi:2-methylisocitrate lyase-like PEP mutase family enzyme